MTYGLILEHKAIDFLAGLEMSDRLRIAKKLNQVPDNPHHFFERLKESVLYRMRVGDYRLIAEISDETQAVKIILIGHRSNIYDRI